MKRKKNKNHKIFHFTYKYRYILTVIYRPKMNSYVIIYISKEILSFFGIFMYSFFFLSLWDFLYIE